MGMVRIMATEFYAHGIAATKITDQEGLILFIVEYGPERASFNTAAAKGAFGRIEHR
jgi:hypothetical protein